LLAQLGWTPALEEQFAPHAADGLEPARVAVEHRDAYVVYTARGERPAELSGRLRHAAAERGDLPAVGDWVAVTATDPALVQAVLPRRTKFSRLAANDHGQTIEQVVAANVDVVFLVSAFGHDLNARRLERYLTAGWDSGADPVVVLNKLDVADDPARDLADVEAVAFGVPVHGVSAADGTGLEELSRYFDGDRTVALLGSSGVGKSSIVNRMLGRDRQDVGEIREDGRGRHTTTYRELLPLPAGGLVLDTPGLRELGLWEAEGGVDETFADVAELAAGCRFRDCAHEREPGCAVLVAVTDGRLAPERLESYSKLLRELRRLDLKLPGRAQAEARRNRRRFARALRNTSY
jgi:ribosome biogenesis GTPase / thiamine phosphate phosphatase